LGTWLVTGTTVRNPGVTAGLQLPEVTSWTTYIEGITQYLGYSGVGEGNGLQIKKYHRDTAGLPVKRV
jgi:hypothetical protein